MALIKDAIIHGISIKNAYFTVANGMLNNKTNLSFVAGFSLVKGEPVISSSIYECIYDINGPNPIAQAYAHLKSLPEFADAIDC